MTCPVAHVAAVADGPAPQRFGGVAADKDPVAGTERLRASEQTPGSLATCGGGRPASNRLVVNSMVDINSVDDILTTGRQ